MLIRVHKVLIASAIGLAALFAIRAFVLFGRGGASIDLGMGIGAVAIVGALAVYLRKVRAKYGSERS